MGRTRGRHRRRAIPNAGRSVLPPEITTAGRSIYFRTRTVLPVVSYTFVQATLTARPPTRPCLRGGPWQTSALGRPWCAASSIDPLNSP
jgi:hypothetical protein